MQSRMGVRAPTPDLQGADEAVDKGSVQVAKETINYDHLLDYQTQLMLLEGQNLKRLAEAREEQDGLRAIPTRLFNAFNNQLSPIARQKQPERTFDDVLEEAAFERAFDAAGLEVQRSESQATVSNNELRRDEQMNTLVEGSLQSDHLVAMKDAEDIIKEFDFDNFLREQPVDSDIALPAGPDVNYQFRSLGTGNVIEFPDTRPSMEHDLDLDMDSDSFLVDDTVRIGSDKILDDAMNERQDHHQNDADELARTAGQLLDNLKHEQSQKFQESNFLALMRQLRDKEVSVEGDKIVGVSDPYPINHST